MKIVLEGCDGTGKTTLANLLADSYNLDVCHCTSKDPSDYDFYYQTARKENIVWDRHSIGELIYPFVFGRTPNIGVEEARLLIAYAREFGTKFLVLTSNIDVIKNRLIERGNEDPRVLEKLEWINNEFLLYAKNFNIPIIDTSKMTISEIFNIIEKEEKFTFIYKNKEENKMSKNKKIYNETQLTPQQEFERHIYHRDQFAHYLRWTHVLKEAKIGQKILDFGCGSGEMLEVFYRNKFRPQKYVGLEIRKTAVEKNKEKFKNLDFANFMQCDLCDENLNLNEKFDVITCFEVVEHIGHANIDVFLNNILKHCEKNTVVYISTPNYDPNVGAANNHMLGKGDAKEVGEWDHFELMKKLNEYFEITKRYGTFASMRDYKYDLVGWKKEMFEALKDYYDTNLISNIMAPLVPAEHARNCLWVLRKKGE